MDCPGSSTSMLQQQPYGPTDTHTRYTVSREVLELRLLLEQSRETIKALNAKVIRFEHENLQLRNIVERARRNGQLGPLHQHDGRIVSNPNTDGLSSTPTRTNFGITHISTHAHTHQPSASPMRAQTQRLSLSASTAFNHHHHHDFQRGAAAAESGLHRPDSARGAGESAFQRQQQHDFQSQTSSPRDFHHDDRGDDKPAPVQQEKYRPTQISAGARRKLRGSCDFCTSTKIKCDGVKPSCTNCERRGLLCTYSERRRPGPKPSWELVEEPTPSVTKRPRVRPTRSTSSSAVPSFDQLMHTNNHTLTLFNFNTHNTHNTHDAHAHAPAHTRAHTPSAVTSSCVSSGVPSLSLSGGSDGGMLRGDYMSQAGGFKFARINDAPTEYYLHT